MLYVASMKKVRRKQLLVSVEKVRELQSEGLNKASGGLSQNCGGDGDGCFASIVEDCCHTLVGGCQYSAGS